MREAGGREFDRGERVEKAGGDYSFSGVVVAAFKKLRSGQWRYVVEDDRGLLMIMNGKQLSRVEEGDRRSHERR